MDLLHIEDERVGKVLRRDAKAALATVPARLFPHLVGVFFYPSDGGHALLLELEPGKLAAAKAGMGSGRGTMAQGRLGGTFHGQYFFAKQEARPWRE